MAVADGESAWEMMQTGLVNLLVTDNEMPRLNGLDLISRLKNKKFEVAIIMISAKYELKETSLKTGANFYLRKPFTIDALLECVQKCIGPKILNSPKKEDDGI